MGTQSAVIFSLAPTGAQQGWSRDVTEQGCVSQEGSSQTSLEHQHISYAGLTPSFLMPKHSSSLLQLFLGLEGSIPAHGFPLLTLPSVEVRSRHTLQEPVLALSLLSLSYQLLKSYYCLYPYMCKVSLHPL